MLHAFEYLEDEGCGYIREFLTLESPVKDKKVAEQIKKVASATIEHATEADKGGRPRKNLVVRIAGIHECVTKNATEYHADELEASIPSWTGPYGKPVITDHNAYEVDRTVGRIVNAEMGTHNGKPCLIFTTGISDKEAVEKVIDGRYNTVSIGARVKSAKCSICDKDWAKGQWCDHTPGQYELKDPEDKDSLALCTLIMGGIQGHEVSFVTVPADENAMVISIEKPKATKKEEADTELGVLLFDESAVDFVSTNGEAVRVAIAVEESGRKVIEGLFAAFAAENTNDPEEESVEDETLGTENDELETTDNDQVADEEVVDEPAAENDDTADAADEAADDADADQADADQADAEPEADAADEAVADADDPEADAEVTADEADEVSADADENADDPADEADQADEAAEDQPAEDVPADESDEADAEDSENVSTVTDELHATLVTLYIERGIANGSFSSEADVQIEELMSKSLADLRIMLKEQAGDGPTLAEKLKDLQGLARTETTMVGSDADKSANADAAKERVVMRVTGRNGKTVTREMTSTPDSADNDEGLKKVRIVNNNKR